jgi:CRP-like cAMP-binding protein
MDYGRLLPHLELVPLPVGWTVQRAGVRVRYLYFLTAGVVSQFHETENGASAEFAVTGSEGVIGVASFLGGESTPSQAVVLSAGYAYRLKVDRLKNEFEQDGPLLHLLLRYTQTLITQMVQTAACNRHHSVEQQLCRWLLLILDRLPVYELSITQERIANMLGVRRESITEVAGNLQKAGLIHYSRGHIAVVDRLGLEALACECYAVVRNETDRLFPCKNSSRTAVAHFPGRIAVISRVPVAHDRLDSGTLAPVS